ALQLEAGDCSSRMSRNATKHYLAWRRCAFSRPDLPEWGVGLGQRRSTRDGLIENRIGLFLFESTSGGCGGADSTILIGSRGRSPEHQTDPHFTASTKQRTPL